LATIGASLQEGAELELVHVDAAPAGAVERLRAAEPAAIALDLAAGRPDFPLSLLRELCERPGLLLIGADPASDELLVLSGHAAKALSVADLVNVIQRKDPHSEP
jgi:hypothetical protein